MRDAVTWPKPDAVETPDVDQGGPVAVRQTAVRIPQVAILDAIKSTASRENLLEVLTELKNALFRQRYNTYTDRPGPGPVPKRLLRPSPSNAVAPVAAAVHRPFGGVSRPPAP